MNIFQKGLFVLVLAVIATIAGVIFIGIVLTMILTLLGNLAIWPVIGAALIGQPITMPMALGIAAAMAATIYLAIANFPRQTDRFFEVFGMIFTLGSIGTIVCFFVGFPLWFALSCLMGGLSGWLVIPCGIATITAWWLYSTSNQTE